jgi:hypothetical protein
MTLRLREAMAMRAVAFHRWIIARRREATLGSAHLYCIRNNPLLVHGWSSWRDDTRCDVRVGAPSCVDLGLCI